MTSIREQNGLIDPPPVYAAEEDLLSPPAGYEKPEALYSGYSASSPPLRYIVFDSIETEQIAIQCASGEGQKAKISAGLWNVEADKSKMRSRMEAAGLTFKPLGREYLNTPLIYLISNPGKTEEDE